MAGEWRKTKEDQWQYIQDDGSKATGWLELDGKHYYLDEKGNRKSDYWLKDDGAWYYLDEDGVMATDCWVDNYYVDSEGRIREKAITEAMDNAGISNWRSLFYYDFRPFLNKMLLIFHILGSCSLFQSMICFQY